MRRAFCFVLLCLLFLTSRAAAQEEAFAWTLRLGGDGLTLPKAMALAADGGVLIAGDTDSQAGDFGPGHGLRDGFVLRLDGRGRVLWRQRYGGSEDDMFTHVLAAMDGGCVAMGVSPSNDGHTRSPRGLTDAFLVRVSAEGETLWTKNLGGAGDDELLDIVETQAGQFLVCGRSKSYNGDLTVNNGGWDAWVALLSQENGRPVWTDSLGDRGDDMFTKIIPSGDGWLLLGEYGEALPAGDDQTPAFEGKPFAMLYGADGKRAWPEPIMLGGSGINRLTAAAPTDIGWVLLGETDSRAPLMPSALGGMDIWLLHLRRDGSVQWQRRFGGGKNDMAYSLTALPSGGYVILGTTASDDGHVTGAHGARDLWVLCVSANGQMIWQQTLGGGEDSVPAGLIGTASGGYLVAGATTSQDGDIGRHASVRTGFLSTLSVNGNLLATKLVGKNEECKLLDLRADQTRAYLMGAIRGLRDGAFVEELFIGRLAEECYPAWE
ncbi:MAG: hypothetical protein FWF69_10455 [Firmicutes bacterium]|nr:hypothetical protein [Bacillota bacterium]